MQVQLDSIANLLAGMYRIVDQHPEKATRRQAILELLVEILDADKAHWAWGRGDADGKVVSPIGIIMVGYEGSERSAFQEMGTDPRMEFEFRQPIAKSMNGRPQFTCTKNEVLTAQQWSTCVMQEYFAKMTLDSWVHSLRFESNYLWSNMLFVRRRGKPEYGSAESMLLDAAMTAIGCLHATGDESVPPEKFENITPRQRTVMTMLLDGLSRKAIAAELNLSLDTVNDHIGAIYREFAVSSSAELAALFLRGK